MRTPERRQLPPLYHRIFWRALLAARRHLPGGRLHHAALAAAAASEAALAGRLFAAAAARYREEIRVEALARLRTHELMLRATAGEDELRIEVERRLLTLRAIESPRPPFEMLSARSLVGTWPALLAAHRGPAIAHGPAEARIAA